MQDKAVPNYFLYGEAPREVDSHFLHLESLDERNRAANWNIQPHSHLGLHHVFHIADGGGVMHADGAGEPFRGACLLLVPAGSVHGFECEPGTRGSVITIADAYLDELFARESSLRPLFDRPRVLELPDADAVDEKLARLRRELNWTAPAHSIVVEALLLMLLVDALRVSRDARREPPQAFGPHAALLARFRGLVEANYREEWTLDDYARSLGVTNKRLRTACIRIADCNPLEMIQDRRVLEAKRLMLYSNLSVSEAAYYLGFSDPAYFSRFFSQRCGLSPRAFREARRGSPRASPPI